MNIFSSVHRDSLAYYLGLVAAKAGLVLVFALVMGEAYVRWSINQDFVFLGGFELEALTLSVFAFTFGVLYVNRAK